MSEPVIRSPDGHEAAELIVVEVGAQPRSRRSPTGRLAIVLAAALAFVVGGLFGSSITAEALADRQANATVPSTQPQPPVSHPSIVGCGGLRSADDIRACFELGWDVWARLAERSGPLGRDDCEGESGVLGLKKSALRRC